MSSVQLARVFGLALSLAGARAAGTLEFPSAHEAEHVQRVEALAAQVLYQGKAVEWHDDMDNVLGGNLLNRLPQPYDSGEMGPNGPAAIPLGAFPDRDACLAACLARFQDKCFSATYYAEGAVIEAAMTNLANLANRTRERSWYELSSGEEHARALQPEGEGGGVRPLGQPARCVAVTSNYFDWFPAHDIAGLKRVSTARVFHGCASDSDCAMNGVCSNTACECHPGWTGPACTRLDLQPTLPGTSAGFNFAIDGQKVSSWGGAPHYDGAGLFHMWVSVFTRHCGIISWNQNSVIVHATSTSLVGPYVPANGTVESSIAFPLWSHEPDVKRGPNGEWVIFFSHRVPDGDYKECDCTDGVTPEACKLSISFPTPNTYMSYAASPYGPWSEPVVVISNETCVKADSNFSPTIKPDGSLLGLWRDFSPADIVKSYGQSRIHSVTATNWKDPATYEVHKANLFAGQIFGPTEDPWVFEAPDGRLHALFHNMYGCYACCGHAFAEQSDGKPLRDLAWTMTGADACGPFVQHLDGSRDVLGRRERPHLLLDAQKRPLMLTNGVTACPKGDSRGPNGHGDGGNGCPYPTSDHSWTLAQPIGPSVQL